MNIPRRRHEAEESLQKAIELDPTTIEYHIELSNLYLKSGIKSKSIVVLNDALKHHPGSPRITDAIAAAGEGNLSAVTEVKPAGKAGPQQKVSRERAARAVEQFNNGLKDFKVKNFGVAVNALSEAVDLDPSKAQYHYYFGLCLVNIAQRRKDAEGPLRKAVELDPARPEYHLDLGNFYIRSGQKAKGLGVLNNALMRHPDSQKLKDAVKAAGGAVTGPDGDEKKGGMFSRLFNK
jgi:predicted Zn-dependent protease